MMAMRRRGWSDVDEDDLGRTCERLNDIELGFIDRRRGQESDN